VGDGGASYEDVPRLGDSGLTASDQVSALEADDPCMCQGVVKMDQFKERESTKGVRSNFAERVCALTHGGSDQVIN